MKTFVTQFIPKSTPPWTMIQDTVEAAGIDTKHITPFYTSDGYNGTQDKKNSQALQNLLRDEYDKMARAEKREKNDEHSDDLTLSKVDSGIAMDDKEAKDQKSHSFRNKAKDSESGEEKKKALTIQKSSEKEWPIVSTVKYFVRGSAVQSFMRNLTRKTSELFEEVKKQPDSKKRDKNLPLFEIPLLTPERSLVVLKVATPFQAEPLFEKAKTFNETQY